MKTSEGLVLQDNTNIEKVLSKKEIPIYKGCKFFLDDEGDLFFIKNNTIYFSQDSYSVEIVKSPSMIVSKKFIVGFIQNDKVYLNADDDYEYTLHMYKDTPGIFLFSFKCLSLLEKKWIDKIQKGILIFKDQTPEVTVQFKKSEPNPPGLGFTYIKSRHIWHKSGSILFYDKTLKKSYLLGQDEDQYFGVELPANPKNIDEAIEFLKPKEIRNINCQRQGEWFIVPACKKNVPNIKDCVVTGSTINLPVDNNTSNVHAICCRDDSHDIRLSKDGTIYARSGFVNHVEHKDVVFTDWVKFLKNTAVRSVSVDGVD